MLEEDEEQPVGFVHVKDILRASETEMDRDSVTARELAREVLAVPETRRIDEILADFQTRGEGQMAVVIDEWGVFEGIVTIEDILEEIVGDIQDEFDTRAQEPSITKRADGAYVVDGGVPVQDVNDRLDTGFQSDDVETIGGFVFSHFGRVPEVGDQIEQSGHVLRVEAVDDARIERLVIQQAPSA
nr:transporter associated domain-containing protein [Halegenticoccus soli]